MNWSHMEIPWQIQEKFRDLLEQMRTVDEELNTDRLMEEYMFLGLRMISGVSAERFNDYFGHSIYDIYWSRHR